MKEGARNGEDRLCLGGEWVPIFLFSVFQDLGPLCSPQGRPREGRVSLFCHLVATSLPDCQSMGLPCVILEKLYIRGTRIGLMDCRVYAVRFPQSSR